MTTYRERLEAAHGYANECEAKLRMQNEQMDALITANGRLIRENEALRAELTEWRSLKARMPSDDAPSCSASYLGIKR